MNANSCRIQSNGFASPVRGLSGGVDLGKWPCRFGRPPIGRVPEGVGRLSAAICIEVGHADIIACCCRHKVALLRALGVEQVVEHLGRCFEQENRTANAVLDAGVEHTGWYDVRVPRLRHDLDRILSGLGIDLGDVHESDAVDLSDGVDSPASDVDEECDLFF